jgi:hypothetical protein
MRHKLLTIKIVAALGIPLFPLGAYFFLEINKASGIQEERAASRDIAETRAAERGSEGIDESSGSAPETVPPISPEILARVFRQPGKGPAREKTPRENETVQAGPVPGDGKFSYLGLIRKSNDQEWLYIKEEETGRIIPVNACLASADEEHCVVEIDGISYFIRRK